MVIDEFASLVGELPEFVTGLVEHRAAGPVARRAPDPGHPAAVRRGVAGDPGQHQPADRAAGHRRRRVHRRHRRPGGGPHRQEHPRPGVRAARLSALTAVPGRPGRRAPAGRGGGRRRALAGRGGRLGALGSAAPAAARPAEDDSNMETDLHVLVDAIKAASRDRRAALPQPLAAGAAGDAAARRPARPTARPADRRAGARRCRSGWRTCRRAGPAPAVARPGARQPPDPGRRAAAGRSRAAHHRRQHRPATSCRDVHLYALDCGNAAMMPLADLPHCGAVVPRTQVDRTDRLLARLTEIARRQVLLAQHGYGSSASSGPPRRPRTACPTWCSCSTAGRASWPPSTSSTAAGSPRTCCGSCARARASGCARSWPATGRCSAGCRPRSRTSSCCGWATATTTGWPGCRRRRCPTRCRRGGRSATTRCWRPSSPCSTPTRPGRRR